jgi:hypothetical protein
MTPSRLPAERRSARIKSRNARRDGAEAGLVAEEEGNEVLIMEGSGL